jgi:hypothetical protein
LPINLRTQTDLKIARILRISMIYLGRLKSWARARMRRITATTSKTAIAVLSAVIIAFVVSVSVFKSVRFFSWEHPGILIVVVAVAGEVICDWNRKKSLKERLKKFFGIMLVSGLLLEIAEAVKSDKKAADAYLDAKQAERDAGQANERAANIESNNLVLQAKLQPRTITVKQREDFINILKNSPKGQIRIGIRHPDKEVSDFTDQVCDMLTNAGFQIQSVMNYPNNLSKPKGGDTIGFFVTSISDMPPYAKPLILAFNAIGYSPTIVTNTPNWPHNPDEGWPSSDNDTLLFIYEKQ